MHDSAIQRMTIEWTRAQPSVGRFIRSFVRDRAHVERRAVVTLDGVEQGGVVALVVGVPDDTVIECGDPIPAPADVTAVDSCGPSVCEVTIDSFVSGVGPQAPKSASATLARIRVHPVIVAPTL